MSAPWVLVSRGVAPAGAPRETGTQGRLLQPGIEVRPSLPFLPILPGVRPHGSSRDQPGSCAGLRQGQDIPRIRRAVTYQRGRSRSTQVPTWSIQIIRAADTFYHSLY